MSRCAYRQSVPRVEKISDAYIRLQNDDKLAIRNTESVWNYYVQPQITACDRG